MILARNSSQLLRAFIIAPSQLAATSPFSMVSFVCSEFVNNVQAHFNKVTGDPRVWFVDSAATIHMTSMVDTFVNYQSIRPFPVRVANGGHLSAIGKGTVRFLVNTIEGTRTSRSS